MNFAILTQNSPTEFCGIGDHSSRFAAALRAVDHHATIIARYGLPANGVEIISGEIGQEWLATVTDRLNTIGADHLILQYTPLMFSSGRWRVEQALYRCWCSLGGRWPTSLIVHETYFRVLRHPSSLLRGTIQKALLCRIAEQSRNVFTASQPLQEEMAGWTLARRPVLLPIGSNIPVVKDDVSALRRNYGIPEQEIVLTLFGGGTSLKWSAGYVSTIEAILNEAKVQHCWLLLGGVPRDWFRFTARVLNPGRLDIATLSAHLQLTDIFLMPHIYGLSAKRGTLMAALEHALPVIGTKGIITDSFWSDVPGVMLVDSRDARQFAEAVIELCSDRVRRHDFGRSNAKYFRDHFAWPRIVSRFFGAIDIN